jgi:hypothetical protein
MIVRNIDSFIINMIHYIFENFLQVFAKLKKYSKHPDFNPTTVGQNSGPCESICLWVLALEHYYDVNKVRKKTILSWNSDR